MDFTIFLSQEALTDLEGAAVSYGYEDPKGGARHANRLLDQALLIGSRPERGRLLPEFGVPELREIRCGYSQIIYRVNTAGACIEIVRFLLHRDRFRPPPLPRLPAGWSS